MNWIKGRLKTYLGKLKLMNRNAKIRHRIAPTEKNKKKQLQTQEFDAAL